MATDFSTGKFSRIIRFERVDDETVIAALADDCHAFQMRLRHNSTSLSAITGQWDRFPNSSCQGAAQAIQDLIGQPLSDHVFQLGDVENRKLHCTHYFDLVSLGLCHISAGRPDRIYRLNVWDSLKDQPCIDFYQNDQLIHNFTIEASRFLSPSFLQGAPSASGFRSWAKNRIAGINLEIAFMVQMAVFVSSSRKLDMNKFAGEPALPISPPIGSCFALQPERAGESIRLASQVIIPDSSADALKFVDRD